MVTEQDHRWQNVNEPMVMEKYSFLLFISRQDSEWLVIVSRLIKDIRNCVTEFARSSFCNHYTCIMVLRFLLLHRRTVYLKEKKEIVKDQQQDNKLEQYKEKERFQMQKYANACGIKPNIDPSKPLPL